ncbi:MAG: preprotein translocase subunit YajC, partial [Clostridia bacterium]|nr:preprotein translocase subunit YajC [Clostridia bacterium]
MNFIFNLLESESQTGAANANAPQGGSWFLWVFVALMALFLVYTFISGKRRNKKMEEEKAKLSDIHPGYKVTTIGGVVGTVVEVDDETNSFVLKT